MKINIIAQTIILFTCLLILTGCGSDTSSPVSPATTLIVDTAPPAIPTSLNVMSYRWWVKIGWDDNTVDSDFAGFNVYRQAFDGSYLVTETPLQESRYIDYYPLSVDCVYAVTAIDETGNESAWAQFPYCPPDDGDPYRENVTP